MPCRTAVLVAAYNAEKTLRAAVESVLTGSLCCRVFVVDDGSRVPVSSVLSTYGGRVEIIRLEGNHGPAAARNAGLAHILAQGYEYVAVQDADDLSYADRLATQVAFLDAHPGVGAVGSWTRHIDEHTGATILLRQRPTQPADVRNMMYFNIGVSHASSVFRASALRAVGCYSEDYPAAEDYELLRRIATRFEIANVPEFLLAYCISSQGQSMRRRRRQLYDRLRIQLKYFDAREWRAWLGAAQTLGAFVVPTELMGTIKPFLMRLNGSMGSIVMGESKVHPAK